MSPSSSRRATCTPGTAADLDTRADIFSLGVVLWELLTGTKPFDDAGAGGGDDTQIDSMLHTRRDGLTEAVLAQLPADCPAALRRVLMTCLAADPTKRFTTGGELAQQLDLCLDARAATSSTRPRTAGGYGCVRGSSLWSRWPSASPTGWPVGTTSTTTAP